MNMIRKKDGSPFRFLIVDDSQAMRNALGFAVRLLGGEVIAQAENGQVALKEYKKWRPDIVLCDIEMPVLDGISTVKQLTELDPQAKIIMVSSLAHRSKVLEAVNAGALYFIVKPFKPRQAAEAIVNIISRVCPICREAV